MSAIEAASVRVSTMADGTLRLIVDIEPRNAQAAFSLFGAPGTALAVAALLPAHQQRAEPEPIKGGKIAKWLGIRCGEVQFRHWLSMMFPLQYAEAIGKTDNERAASVIRAVCNIESRAELDNDPAATERFHSRIRAPWAAYQASKDQS